MDIETRDYKTEDFEGLVSNLKQAGMFNADLDTADSLAKKILDRPGSVIVAELDGQIVGSVYIILDKWQSFIFRLVVKEENRKQGIGTMLMNEAEERIKAFGSPAVSGTLRESNIGLEKYYEKLGYEPAKILHRYVNKKFKKER